MVIGSISLQTSVGKFTGTKDLLEAATNRYDLSRDQTIQKDQMLHLSGYDLRVPVIKIAIFKTYPK